MVTHLSNEKTLVVLGYVGDDELPSFIGVLFHKPVSKDPVFKQPGPGFNTTQKK